MAISVRQTASQTSGSSGSLTIGFGSNILAGSLVVVITSANLTSVGPSFGGPDTYVSTGGSLIHYCLNSAGGYVFVSASGSTGPCSMVAYEVTGATVVDKKTFSNFSTTGGTPTGPSINVNTTLATEIWFAAGEHHVTNATQVTGDTCNQLGTSLTNTQFNNLSAGGTATEMTATIGGYTIVSSTGNFAVNFNSSYGTSNLSTTFDDWYSDMITFGASVNGTASFAGHGTFTSTANGIQGNVPFNAMGTFQSNGVVTQKLIVSAASEAGTTSDGFSYPAGVGVYGTGGLFAYSGEAVMGDLVCSIAPVQASDSAGNPYNPGFTGPQLTLAENASPKNLSGMGTLWVDASGNLWYRSPGGTSTKLANN